MVKGNSSIKKKSYRLSIWDLNLRPIEKRRTYFTPIKPLTTTFITEINLAKIKFKTALSDGKYGRQSSAIISTTFLAYIMKGRSKNRNCINLYQ